MKLYTVVLLRPAFMCCVGDEAYGQNIYVALVRASDSLGALITAQREACSADSKEEKERAAPYDVRPQPSDYKLCAMFLGHHDVELFGWQL